MPNEPREVPAAIKCACHSTDAYDCWASRYHMGRPSPMRVENDGGPCQCACHDGAMEDDREW